MPQEKRQSKSQSKTKKTGSTELRKSIAELTVAVDDLRDELQRQRPPSGTKRFFGNLGTGIIKGLGFLLGTTIVAGIIFFLIFQVLKSPTVKNYIGQQLAEILEASVSNIAPEFDFPGIDIPGFNDSTE